MTASEKSFVGLAKQTAKGTPNTTDSAFNYFLFVDGSSGPSNVVLPLDQEVGGGAMLRSLAKVGVTSGGAYTIIPRPTTLGNFLHGALGTSASPVDNLDGSYDHVFDLGADQFAAPYYTLRSAPGNIWGEQFPDARVAGLTLTWRAADYLRGSVALLGGEPTKVSTASWSALTYLDGGPQFLAPLFTIELPTATAVKCLSGAVTMGMNIPLDEQWITGSYSPDDFDINSRAFAITMVVKVTDDTLYTKMAYDPASGSAWAAEIYKEADFLLQFDSDQDAGSTPTPFSLLVEANGQNAASGDANVAWSVTPIALRAGRQVTMAVTGTFLADPLAGEPITVTLTNDQSTQY